MTNRERSLDTERVCRLVEENLRLLAELRATYGPGAHGEPGDVIRQASDIDALLRPEMEGLVQEQLRVVILNTRNKVLDTVMVYQGQVSGVTVRLAEVFREAVIRNAPSIIVAHNHPSGDPSPSPEDLTITKAMAEAGKLLGIEMLDHLIIGRAGQFWSFAEKGLLK